MPRKEGGRAGMSEGNNGNRGVLLGAAATAGLAVITAVVGFIFNAAVENSKQIDRCHTTDIWQDESIKDLGARVKSLEIWQYNSGRKPPT